MVLLLVTALSFFAELFGSSLGIGYGMILCPVLIILGFDLLVVIPSVLLSQAAGGVVSAVIHHKLENVDLRPGTEDSKIFFGFAGIGALATIIGALLAVNLPEEFVKSYIGVLGIVIGLVLATKVCFIFSLTKMFCLALWAGFNKAVTGGGFIPVVTGGQVICGGGHQRAVGITSLAKVPVCLAALTVYILSRNPPDISLLVALLLGTLLATPFGALMTKKISAAKFRAVASYPLIALGVWLLFKTWVF